MKILKKLFSRTTFMVIMIILEIRMITQFFKWFGNTAAWIEIRLRIIGVLIVLYIVNNSKHLSSDMLWILSIMVSPVFGTALYLLLGANLLSSETFHNILIRTLDARKYYKQDPEVLKEMEEKAPVHSGQFRYISEGAYFPFYRNTGFNYYGLGDEGYPVMLEELKKAEKFIFMEYFIIEEGTMWNGMLEILKQKAAEGLDVRVLYDDLGSFFTLPLSYARQLEEYGIKCIPFNKINPFIGSIANHRDHRKIMVIDGKVAFSGGVNLADEYINVKVIHGHWKDNIIRITGEAVWSYTVLFLTHWNALRKTDDNYTVFKVESEPTEQFDGYIAPYGETPLGDERTAQNIYLNILNQAKDYCYIFTPYLMIDTDFINSLILAAKRGVDVRLMTPGVPDKKLVYKITQSYYRNLLRGGVRIIEYTPGFVHAKVFVCDDKIATVGTVNLDYRSLYLHFENGTYLYDVSAVMDIKKDFLDTLTVSTEVSLKDRQHARRFRPLSTLLIGILKLFAPLM